MGFSHARLFDCLSLKGCPMETTILSVLGAFGALLSALCCYWSVYTIVGLFGTRKFPKAKQQHKLAIVIAARNEEAVIGNLIASIRKQDYPAELVTTFVVADNCTDHTAQVARKLGAICYEHNDPTQRTKGFALKYLFEQIEKDYGIESQEAYIIFDADNLLKSDFLSRMNEAFDAGEKIVTSYRNTKNFDENWISASYALHWLRTVRLEHRARSLFGLATRIQGTGFLFSNELVKNGWKYTSLTEDRAFSADAVVAGYSISYCHAAQFYDEQPTDMKTAMRQRIRWAKGHLQAFVETGWLLFKHIFTSHSAPVAFMSYDMLCIVAPRSLYGIFVNILKVVLTVFAWLFFGRPFGAVGLALLAILKSTGKRYLSNIAAAIYVFISERKRIKKMPLRKKIWFTLTFPLFDIIGRISTFIAFFRKVEWTPIPHNSSVTIDDLHPETETVAK